MKCCRMVHMQMHNVFLAVLSKVLSWDFMVALLLNMQCLENAA